MSFETSGLRGNYQLKLDGLRRKSEIGYDCGARACDGRGEDFISLRMSGLEQFSDSGWRVAVAKLGLNARSFAIGAARDATRSEAWLPIEPVATAARGSQRMGEDVRAVRGGVSAAVGIPGGSGFRGGAGALVLQADADQLSPDASEAAAGSDDVDGRESSSDRVVLAVPDDGGTQSSAGVGEAAELSAHAVATRAAAGAKAGAGAGTRPSACDASGRGGKRSGEAGGREAGVH